MSGLDVIRYRRGEISQIAGRKADHEKRLPPRFLANLACQWSEKWLKVALARISL
jgi:hypothetical protein